jgi:tetratricopeptide (TPR) repeat protein
MKRLVVGLPDNGAAWQNLAVAQFMRARYDEGLESCHEALRCDPGNVAVMYNLALALGHLRRYDEALRQVRTALRDHGRDPMLVNLEFRLKVLRVWHGVTRIFRWRFSRR